MRLHGETVHGGVQGEQGFERVDGLRVPAPVGHSADDVALPAPEEHIAGEGEGVLQQGLGRRGRRRAPAGSGEKGKDRNDSLQQGLGRRGRRRAPAGSAGEKGEKDRNDSHGACSSRI